MDPPTRAIIQIADRVRARSDGVTTIDAGPDGLRRAPDRERARVTGGGDA